MNMALRSHFSQLQALLGVNLKQYYLVAHSTSWLPYSSAGFKNLTVASICAFRSSSVCQNVEIGSSFKRFQSTSNEQNKSSKINDSSLSEVKESAGKVTIGHKVKQTTKDAYYTGIIIAGVTVTGIMFYTIFRELFSKESPNGVYSDALKLCKENFKVVDTIGEPIKAYGETTSRGRRRHVSHVEFEHDGVKCMRMKFYIQGNRRKATVHLEVRQNDKRKYEYRYLFVELDGYPGETIILQDNR